MFGGPLHHRGHGRQRGGLGLLMLFGQMHQLGLGNIPPVTLAVIAANVAIFLGLYPPLDMPLRYVCISFGAVAARSEWHRVWLSSLYHADDWHLSYNMISFLWKGYNLERHRGTVSFAVLLGLMVLLVPLLYLFIVFIAIHLDAPFLGPSVAQECAVGFSGVIFALKVVTTHDSEAMHDVFYGLFSVQGKYVVWAELIIMHLIYPGSSLIGHLAGILAGMIYTQGYLLWLTMPLERMLIGLPAAHGGGRGRAADGPVDDGGDYYANQYDQHRQDARRAEWEPNDHARDTYARSQAAAAADRRRAGPPRRAPEVD